MQRLFFSVCLLLLINFPFVTTFAQNTDAVRFFDDEQRRQRDRFIGLRMNSGTILPTDELTSTFDTPYYQSFSLRFGFRSTGESWQDFAFGMPYVGFGLYVANFPTKREVFGNPIALYMFHGGNILNFTHRWSMHYEWHLGAAFNWNHFDPFDNPENIVIGSSVTAYASVNVYSRFRLTPRLDINAGVGFSHFSNGAHRLPNRGMNLLSPFVELAYSLDNRERTITPVVPIAPPAQFQQRIDYDFTFTVSSRQIDVDTIGTGLPSRYLDHNFPVLGFSFAPFVVPNHRYRYGLSLDVVYDRSSNARAWREQHPVTGHWHDRIALAPVGERFAVGLSARGEITMPLYTFFAGIGYNFIQQTSAPRLYQMIGIKIHPRNDLFATFGVRATNFSRAQYLYWSLGYTFQGKPIRRRR